MNPTSIRFGPAGNSDSFYAAGYKRTADAPAYLQAMGLDALEYSFGRGVRMGHPGSRPGCGDRPERPSSLFY